MKRFVLQGRGITPEWRIPYEEELNAEQLAVVAAGGGPILVIAGAGTGKTRTLTYRVARLVESRVPPESILLLTFTNKAAREMLRRVEGLLGSPSLRVTGGTFHHVGNLILRRHAALLSLPPGFSILDRGDGRDLLRQVIGEMGLEGRKARLPSPDALISILSFAVNTMRPVDEVLQEKQPEWADETELVTRILAAYHERKLRIGAVDYDDLLLSWLTLMERHPPVAAELRARFSHVLVDEYQDTNRLQGLLIDAMVGEHRNVTVVGDDAQSIYAFRGAHFDNIFGFPERYPDARVFRLVTNYRSQPAILELANASIVNNRRQFPKELRPVRPPASRPMLARCRDVSQQAALVCEYILTQIEEGRELADVAVLYRSNFQSLEIQAEMTRRKIPYAVFGGIRFFEQAHVKDVVAYLRVLENPRDELAWMRLLPLIPKIGARTAARITPLLGAWDGTPDAGAAVWRDVPKGARAPFGAFLDLMGELRRRREDPPPDLLALVVDRGYEGYLKEKFPNWRSRREDLTQLSTFASGYRTLGEFLSELALLGSTPSETVVSGPDDGRPVTLTTVHQAKGLEWPVVILVGLADGSFPSGMSLREPDGEEEERRLFYVAVTRTRDELLMAFPVSRWMRGSGAVLQKPSRFLTELPDEVREELAVEESIPDELPALPPARPLALRDPEGFADPEIADEDWFRD